MPTLPVAAILKTEVEVEEENIKNIYAPRQCQLRKKFGLGLWCFMPTRRLAVSMESTGEREAFWKTKPLTIFVWGVKIACGVPVEELKVNCVMPEGEVEAVH